MPRAFSPDERLAIKRRIKSAAQVALRSYGFKKMTVADLADAAGISKGAFYLFYRAKEDVVMELIADYEATMRTAIDAEFQKGPTGREALRRVLHSQIRAACREPLIRDLVSGDLLQLIWRGAGEESRAASFDDDEAFLAGLAENHLTLSVSPAVAAGMLRAVVIAALQRDQVGYSVADAVIEGLVDAVVAYLVKGGKRTREND